MLMAGAFFARVGADDFSLADKVNTFDQWLAWLLKWDLVTDAWQQEWTIVSDCCLI